MSDENKAAEGQPKGDERPSAFEWSARKAAELNATHDGQWSNFLDVFVWRLNGWAMRDVGADGSPWILTDAGKALSEADFNAGVGKALAITWK